MDVFTPEKRSEVMSRIRSGNTKPELALLSMLHRLGYRFTVHGPKNKFLPGRPDLFSFSHPDSAPISRKPRLLRTSKHTKMKPLIVPDDGLLPTAENIACHRDTVFLKAG